MTNIRRLALTGLMVLLAAPAVRADCHYVIVFGAQSKPQRPKYSHSWGVFVRVPDPTCAPAGEVVAPESFIISWMPAEIELHPNRVTAEPGINLDLATTFRVAMENCENVSAWGPFQIKKELYCLAANHARRLNAGDVRYKTIDFGRNPLNVSNCIHALTVFNYARLRPRIGRTNFGEVASYFVARNYEDWIICPNQTHCWVADLVGLGQYPIRWRRLEDGRPYPSREK